VSARVARSDPGSWSGVEQGARSLRRFVAVLLAPLCLCACGGGGLESGTRAELERLEHLAFVAPGRPSLVQGAVRDASQLAVEEPLLVGMYEVTRGEFREFLAESGSAIDPLDLAYLERAAAGDESLPVSFVTRDEAAAYARWAGLRLLTSAEWLFCALSPRTLAYPWADSWQQGRANTFELGLVPYAPTPVGTFEGGRTATRLYDMLGNVWEWVSDDLRPDADPGTSASAFGGSYLSYKREIYRGDAFFEQALVPGDRFDDVGFRVGSSARHWLEQHAAELGDGEQARRRLNAIGRRWGSGAVQLLSELAASAREASARRALEALLAGARG